MGNTNYFAGIVKILEKEVGSIILLCLFEIIKNIDILILIMGDYPIINMMKNL
jgi:hypothetical protein